MNHLSQTFCLFVAWDFICLEIFFFSLMFTARAAWQLPSVITTCWGLYYSVLQMWHQKLLFQNNCMLLLELIPTSPNKNLLVDPWKVFSLSLILMRKYWNFKMPVVDISCSWWVFIRPVSVMIPWMSDCIWNHCDAPVQVSY